MRENPVKYGGILTPHECAKSSYVDAPKDLDEFADAILQRAEDVFDYRVEKLILAHKKGEDTTQIMDAIVRARDLQIGVYHICAELFGGWYDKDTVTHYGYLDWEDPEKTGWNDDPCEGDDYY